MKLNDYKPKGKFIVLERIVRDRIGSLFIPSQAEGELIPEFKVIKAGPHVVNAIEGEIVLLLNLNYLNQLTFEDNNSPIYTCEDTCVIGGYVPKEDS